MHATRRISPPSRQGVRVFHDFYGHEIFSSYFGASEDDTPPFAEAFPLPSAHIFYQGQGLILMARRLEDDTCRHY